MPIGSSWKEDKFKKTHVGEFGGILFFKRLRCVRSKSEKSLINQSLGDFSGGDNSDR